MIDCQPKRPITRKIRLTLITLITLSLFSCASGDKGDNSLSGADLSELYERIDEEIGRSQVYTTQKERRINMLKQDLRSEDTDIGRLRTFENLVTEYEDFVCDSALKYVEEARHMAENSGNEREQMRLLIKKADIASHAGLFTEAQEMLQSVDRKLLDADLLGNYYAAYAVLYQYESEYLPVGEYSERSKQLQTYYIDSLLKIMEPGSFTYLTNWSNIEIEKGNFEAVEKQLEENMAHYEPGTRQYSILASTLSRMYKAKGDESSQKRYLAMTVLSDLQAAVKENMAIRELAERVFEDGDIERANRYMKQSLDDASFYAAALNTAQSSRMLPVIDAAYDREQKRQHRHLRALIYITSILLLMAIGGLVVIMRQMHRIKEANRKASVSNDELQKMSERLQEMNGALERSNRELKVSNRTAEEYAGLFMEYSSLTISNLQRYHLALRNLALQGNVKGLLKKLDSGDATADMLKSFYQKFDEAILTIYPQFVDKVNALLTPEGQIVLKPGEKLNTELRILALIRIGINDSEKISEFLRCSITTIYTYRSKLKRRALDPERFEEKVMEI